MNGSDVEIVVGCGVADHDTDCLCDVHVTSPTPIGVRLVDNWVLRMVADYFDMSWPWTPAKLAFLLEKSAVFIDEYRKDNSEQARQVAHIAPRVMEGPRGTRESFPEYAKRAKETMAEVAAVLGDKCLPSQVRELCQMKHDDMVAILSMNRADPTVLTPEVYDGFVNDLRGGETFTVACNKYGFPRDNRAGTGAWLKQTFVTQFN